MQRGALSAIAAAIMSFVAVAVGISSAGAATRTIAASSQPIKIGLITSVTASFNPEPWLPNATKIGVAAVNGAGGVNGRKLKLYVCDDHNTPQAASLCATQLLVQDKVLMLVGDDGFEESSVLPTVAAQNTIDWATLGSNPAALTNKRAYILAPIITALTTVPQMLPSGVTKVAFLNVDTAVNQTEFGNTAALFPKTDTLTNVLIPPTATNFQSYCLQVKNSGAQAVVAQLPNEQIPPAIEACHQLGLTKTIWILNSALSTPEVAKAIQTENQPNFVFESYSPKAVSSFKSDIKKYGAQVGPVSNIYNDTSIGAYIGVKMIPELFKGAGSLNPEKMGAWVDKQKALNTLGATPPLNFTKFPVGAEPRVKNVYTYKAEFKNGQLVYPTSKVYTAPQAG